MKPNISRRTFLKTSLGAAGAVVSSSGLARAAAVNGSPGTPLATLIDISRCIGCEECVFACRQTDTGKYPAPEKPFPGMIPSRVPVEDWSDRQDVTDRLTPYNWLFIQHARGQKDGQDLELTIPRRCMHCVNPPCVKLCPWGAAKQEENGLSWIDAELCLGGAKCRQVCPWDIPQRQTGVGLYLDLVPSLAGNGVMYKCDRCFREIETGGVPACIEACPEGVQTIGPRSSIIRAAHDLAREMNGYIYGETENGGTNTIYVSPVPFASLTMETGKGKPHLNPVGNRMGTGTHLALAMLMAPVAGAAAAFGKLYRRTKEKRECSGSKTS